MTNLFLSIVIPARNEETRLPSTLEQVVDFLNVQPYATEVLIIENGSQDRTLQIAQDFARHHPQVRVLQCSQVGKGAAVRLGMLAARGEYRFMCDADFSMPIQQVNHFFPPALNACDIAIASREAPGAVRYNEPFYRHFVGRAYNWMIRLIALPGLQDTQCGFKCFRGALVKEIFSLQTLTGWAFDVEILFIARRRGYTIAEVPIPWYYNSHSKISVLHDSIRMGLDLLTIRRNGWRGLYDR
ncbi:MAG: glycosyltransferase family 2 protein [Anaerolineales bacterium]|nr:glycosyltransferase family 2 protein [Anaerolineales bacterium]